MKTQQEPNYFRALLGRRTAVYAGISALVIVFVSAWACFFPLSNAANGYLEKKIEKEFTKKYPSYSLKISGFNYNIWKNRIGVDSLVLESADSGFSCQLGASQVEDIRWLRLLGTGKHKARALLDAVADVQEIFVKLKHSDYGFSCKRLHLSLATGEMAADAVELKPVVDDDRYFAARKYRATRFKFQIPKCRVTGLAVPELLEGKSYQTKSIQLQEPAFDMLVDMYVPVDPGISPSSMPNEMLNSIKQHLRIEKVEMKEGKLKYGEIYARGTTPAVVTFDNMQLQSEGIANYGKSGDITVVQGQAVFMQGAVMKLDIAIPLSSPDFSFKYSGSLSPMKINKLNPFLEHSEYLRINAGTIVQTITYDIQVSSGQASGVVKAPYKNLEISILNKKTGSSRDIINEIASFMTNNLKLRSDNMPDSRGTLTIGKVEYKRRPLDTFIQFLWFSLRSGVLDVIFM